MNDSKFSEETSIKKTLKGVDIVDKYFSGTHFFISKKLITNGIIGFVISFLIWFFNYAQKETWSKFPTKQSQTEVLSLIDPKNPVARKNDIKLIKRDYQLADKNIIEKHQSDKKSSKELTDIQFKAVIKAIDKLGNKIDKLNSK